MLVFANSLGFLVQFRRLTRLAGFLNARLSDLRSFGQYFGAVIISRMWELRPPRQRWAMSSDAETELLCPRSWPHVFQMLRSAVHPLYHEDQI